MSEYGFIKLSRGFQNHWLWEEKRKFSKAEAWIDLIFRAQWQDKKQTAFKDGSKYIVVETDRGTVKDSIRSLSKDWGWTVDRTVLFLKTLQEHKQISKQRVGKQANAIKIVKYNDFNPTLDMVANTNPNRVPNSMANTKPNNIYKRNKEIKKNNTSLSEKIPEIKNVPDPVDLTKDHEARAKFAKQVEQLTQGRIKI